MGERNGGEYDSPYTGDKGSVCVGIVCEVALSPCQNHVICLHHLGSLRRGGEAAYPSGFVSTTG